MNDKQRIVDGFEYSGNVGRDSAVESFRDFMLKDIYNAEYIIFQSDFSFLNGDCPFTMIVERDEDELVVTYWLNDWGTFSIETPSRHKFLSHWRLHTRSDQIKMPDWKNHTAKSLIEKYTAFSVGKSLTFSKDIIDPKDMGAIIDRVFNYYPAEEKNPRTDNFWKGKIAVLYYEPIM